jgi:hypothetical protein
MTPRSILATLVLGIGLALATHASPAAACSCAVVEGTEQLGLADLVFAGTLDAVDGPAELETSTEAVFYRFTVDEVFKGSTTSDATVASAASSASCGLSGMTVGARYVVFATVLHTEEEARALPGASAGELSGSLCGGTAELGPDGPPAFLGQGRLPSDAGQGTPGDDGDGGSSWVVPVLVGLGALAAAGAGGLFLARRRAGQTAA